MEIPKIDNSLIGAAGVHFIASELSLRGLIALPTIRNTAGVDILITSTDGKWHANLQVKTSRNRVNFWPIGSRYKEWNGKNNWYAFARYLKNESRFEIFLESAQRVEEQVTRNIARGKESGAAEWAPCWYLPKDATELERVRRQWSEFGLPTETQ